MQNSPLGFGCHSKKSWDFEFEEGDKVYFIILPTERVVRFCNKGMLSSRYVGPYESCNGLEGLLMS